MYLDPEARIEPLSHEMWFAMGFVSSTWRALGLKEPTVTSGNDGTHKEGSLHYRGAALDLRTRDLTPVQAVSAHTFLRRYLDPLGFDTILEEDHLHIEYDPKPGETILKPGTP